MANETEQGNIVNPTNVISDAIAPALVQGPVVPALIYYEAVPDSTKVRLWRKDGYLTASEVNESAVLAIDGAEEEITQTSVTGTAVKLAAACIVTVEAERFSKLDALKVAGYLGGALGRDWEDEILALFSGFTTSTVTSTSVKTWDDILQSAYYVRANTAGVADGPLVHVSDYKGIYELRKEAWNKAASPLSLVQNIEILRGFDLGGKGYQGEQGGVLLYQTNGLPTSGSDDVSLTFDPYLAFGAMADNMPSVESNFLGAGDGTRGFAREYVAWMFCDVIEWNDQAGCPVLSDT
jgi:hypothetical protein